MQVSRRLFLIGSASVVAATVTKMQLVPDTPMPTIIKPARPIVGVRQYCGVTCTSPFEQSQFVVLVKRAFDGPPLLQLGGVFYVWWSAAFGYELIALPDQPLFLEMNKAPENIELYYRDDDGYWGEYHTRPFTTAAEVLPLSTRQPNRGKS